MAYTKQNFENGQILTAEQLNHMEDGIERANSILVESSTNSITWDGVGGALSSEFPIARVSDMVLPAEAFSSGGSAKVRGMSTVGQPEQLQWSAEDVVRDPETVTMVIPTEYQTMPLPIIWAVTETTTLEGLTLTPGVYFLMVEALDAPIFTEEITFNGYTISTEQIAPALLPKTDWNNVINKPFYDIEPWIPPVTLPEPGEERMIIRDHMISSSATDKVCWLKENTRYVVNFNGTDYECVSFTYPYNPQFKGNVYLGNLSIQLSHADSNGMPFLLLSNTNLSPAGTDVMLEDDSLTTCTISIRIAADPTTKRIDPKYIPVPDWNNMTNRPFGDEIAEVIPEAEMSGAKDEAAPVPVYAIEFDPSLFDGSERTLVIRFDGIDYLCNAIDLNGMPGFGNAGMMGMGEDTGEPFAFVLATTVGFVTMFVADGNLHTIGVKKVEAKKIDPRYYDAHRVVYIADDEHYLYADPALSVRLTQSDLERLVAEELSIQRTDTGVVTAALKPLLVAPYYGPYGAVIVYNGDEFVKYYTAEYTD